MITPTHAANVVQYLADAGGLTLGSDAQASVWADVINADAPRALPEDLRPACVLALRWRTEQGRYGQLTAADYAAALRSIIDKRPQARCPIHTTEIAGMCLPCKQAKDPRIITSQGEPA